MRQKTLIGLAIATVAVTAIALLLPNGGNTGPIQVVAGGKVFPTLKDWVGASTKLTVTGSDGTIILERKPKEAWTLTDKGGYPVQDSAIKPVLSGLEALNETEAKTDRPALYSRLDLGDPGKESQSHALDLSDDAAHSAKVIIGKHKADPIAGGGADAIYIRKPGEARTWLAAPGFQLPADALGWIDHAILDVDTAKVKSVVVTLPGGKPLAADRDKPADKLTLKDLPKDAKLKGEDPGGELAGGFRDLELGDVESAAKLNGTPAGTGHVVTFDGLTVDLALTKQGDTTWATVTAQGTGDAAKAAADITQRTKGWAYKLDDERVTTLETKLADLLEPPPEKPEPPAKPEPKKPGKP